MKFDNIARRARIISTAAYPSRINSWAEMKNKIQLGAITFKLRKSFIVTASWCLLRINEDEKWKITARRLRSSDVSRSEPRIAAIRNNFAKTRSWTHKSHQAWWFRSAHSLIAEFRSLLLEETPRSATVTQTFQRRSWLLSLFHQRQQATICR